MSYNPKQRSRCAKRTCFFVSLFFVRLKPTRHHDCATSCAEQGLRSKLAASLATVASRMVRCPGHASVRGSHNGATILHPNTKALDFGGLFVFLGVKNILHSPLHLFEFLGLEPLTNQKISNYDHSNKKAKSLYTKAVCCGILYITQ